MHFSKSLIVSVLASVGLVSAFTGSAVADNLGTTPCGVPGACPGTFNVAISEASDPTHAHCCQNITVSFEGNTVQARVVSVYLAAQAIGDINLSGQAFQVLAPIEGGKISPVTWDFV